MKEKELDLEILQTWYEKVYARQCEAVAEVGLAHIKFLEKMPPFVKYYCRIKTFDSMIEKCGRKNCDLTPESIKKNIKDVAGIRIVTPYIDEVEIIEQEIRKIPAIIVKDRKDYVNHPKDNGYRSLHLCVGIRMYSSTNGTNEFPVEIQIRTRIMDMWAGLEHILNYKNPAPSPESKKFFKQVAKNLGKLENDALEMRKINERPAVQKFQAETEKIVEQKNANH